MIVTPHTYVGQTKRLATKIRKHKSNIKLDPTKYSVVAEYIKTYKHSFDNVKVLDKKYNYYKQII